MARPVGSNKEWQANKKTIKTVADTKKWANALAPKIRAKLEELIDDPNASPTVQKGVCEFIWGIIKDNYKELGGNADYIKETSAQRDKRLREEQQQQAKKATEKNGGSAPLKPLINLTYEEPKTGTEDE